MLQHAKQLKERGESGQQPVPRPPVDDLTAQLRSAMRSLEQPRTQIAAGLLRPGHVLPTRSLREQVQLLV